MDPAILSAASALARLVFGGVSTLTASWFTQRGQLRAQMLVQAAVRRETLYAEFIIEASKRFTEAWVTRPRALKLSRISTPRSNGCT